MPQLGWCCHYSFMWHLPSSLCTLVSCVPVQEHCKSCSLVWDQQHWGQVEVVRALRLNPQHGQSLHLEDAMMRHDAEITHCALLCCTSPFVPSDLGQVWERFEIKETEKNHMLMSEDKCILKMAFGWYLNL